MELKIRTGEKTRQIRSRDMREYRLLLNDYFNLVVKGDFKELPGIVGEDNEEA